MANNIFNNITQRGTNALFQEALQDAPNVWEKHCQKIPSDAPDEAYVWLGNVPIPREWNGQRQYQGMRDFTFTVTNKEYEMSFVIDQTTMEDDRHGLLNQRIREALGAWPAFKDSLFSTLLTAGGADLAYDGVSFFNTTRTIGDSGTILNYATENIADPNAPTAAELAATLKAALETMRRYADDQGRPGYSAGAMSELRAIVPPEQEKIFVEFLNSTLISNSSNPWGEGLIQSVDVLPYLADADNSFYLSAVGSVRKPYIYQERTSEQIEVLNGSDFIAENHGVKVLCRQRFRFAYGEPRYAFERNYT